MAEVLLYHHIQGLTDGVRPSPTSCGRPGTPCTRPTCSTGARSTRSRRASHSRARRGSARSRSAASPPPRRLDPGLVYAGFSFGVTIAQQLAQTRPGARGALLMYSCLPVSEFGEAWPEGVPVQVHGKEGDPFFDEDLEAAQALVGSTDRGRALPLSRGPAPLRRLLAPGVRRRRCGVAHRARAGVPRRCTAVSPPVTPAVAWLGNYAPGVFALPRRLHLCSPRSCWQRPRVRMPIRRATACTRAGSSCP